MDYSKFTDDNFDVKEWVNTAFKSQKDGQSSKDQYATTLVMKLQMFIQEVNNVIEESCQQVIQNLPRVMRELDAVKQESALLQEQMKMVKEDVQKVEHDTAQSMQMLLKLDTIKSRMKDASDALQEADNWTTLSADVEQVFQSQDINAIAERLVGMQQSLQMLTDVPDYTERCQHLETLKNRLEALLSPQLVAAFNVQSLDDAQMYVKIFTDIDRLPQLYKYYHKCHKRKLTEWWHTNAGQLLQSWRQIVEFSQEENLAEWMTQLYDQLLSTWHTQMQWCSQAFEDPVSIVCELLTETLSSLDPSLPVCISAAVKEKQGNSLLLLIELKQITERFAKSLEGAVSSYTAGNLGRECIEKLAAIIYAPYKVYIHQYSFYEEQQLAEELNSIVLDHEEVIDSVRLLGESVAKSFAAANAADGRCVQFTNGCAYVGLIQALQTYFNSYLNEFKRVVTNIREKCKVSSVDSEDWSLFQHSLRIIQAAGELIIQTDELDQNLVNGIVSSLGSYHQHLLSPSKKTKAQRDLMKRNPFQSYTQLLIDREDEQQEVEALYSKLQEGEAVSVLELVRKQMCKLSTEVHKFAFDIVFAPINQQLAAVHQMEIWTSDSAGGALTSDLPTFSLSPQEYITKVGQYLMTLPQQLEPFTVHDNPALMTAIRHGNLPYTSEQSISEHLADVWLESVARGTMHTYSEQILKITEISSLGNKQLTTDIDYMFNVLEDLALPMSDTLDNISKLMKASPEEFKDAAEKLPQRLAGTVATMRNIPLA